MGLDGVTVTRRGSGPVLLEAPVGNAVRAAARVSGSDDRGGFVPMLYVHGPGETAPRLTLGQRGSDIVFTLALRGARARLRQPGVSVRGVLGADAPPGIRYTVTGAAAGDSLVATFDAGSGARRAALHLSPTLGWALLSPWPSVGTRAGVLATVLWVAGLAAPLGYWSAWAAGGERRRATVVAAVVAGVLAAGLGATPRLGSLAPAAPWEWAAALGGAAFGAAGAAVVRRRG